MFLFLFLSQGLILDFFYFYFSSCMRFEALLYAIWWAQVPLVFVRCRWYVWVEHANKWHSYMHMRYMINGFYVLFSSGEDYLRCRWYVWVENPNRSHFLYAYTSISAGFKYYLARVKFVSGVAYTFESSMRVSCLYCLARANVTLGVTDTL